jgi:hypothetical protein
MPSRPWIAVVALLLASCQEPSASPAPSSPAPPAALDCRDSQNGDAGPSQGLEILLDAAALPTQRVLQANEHNDGWLFAKVGLYVRPHLTVELSVGPGTDAGVTYGPGERAESVVLPQCTVLPGRWIVYTGGYYVRKPMCLPIRLRASGNEAQTRIAVGAPCP